jgi:hypothetical protein
MTPRPRKESQHMRKLTHAQVRSIAARLLDDMCANMGLLKTFSKYDVAEVAISLGEMLADENHAEYRE